MTKHKKRILPTISGIMTALFLAACGGVLEAPTAADGDKSRVIISITAAGGLPPAEAVESADPAARTLLPEFGALDYRLEFTRQGETEPILTETTTETTLEREIEPGDYTLIVTAYTAGTNVAVAGGSALLTAPDGQAVNVPVSLTASLRQEAAGSLEYAVTLPPEITLIRGFLTLYPLDEEGDPVPVSFDLSAGLSGTGEIASGYYRAQLMIYGGRDGAVKSAAKTKALHINDSLQTTVSYTLSAADFTGLAAENAGELSLALSAIRDIPAETFTIFVTGDFSSPPVSLADAGYNGKTITLLGDGAIHEISLSSPGSLFTIGSASSEPVFILRDIALKGISDNNAALLKVDNGALIMEDGAAIAGNTASNGGGVYVAGGSFTMRGNASVSGNTASDSASGSGGGVYVESGTFAMQDNASVSDNTASRGGGVYAAGGSFTMQDNASVSGNTASNGGGLYAAGDSFTMRDNASVSDNTGFYGGGVYMYVPGGSFTMRDNASVSGNSTDRNGGGVYVDEGTFVMQDNASVSGNSTDWNGGGGVYVAGGGSFTMRDNASVSENTTLLDGSGGVYVAGGGSFTMRGSASVSGNSANGDGGGVYVGGGTVTMQDSTSISGNSANGNGGGVYVAGGGSFTMQDSASVSGNSASSGGGVYIAEGGIFAKQSGGIIYGQDADNTLRNTAGGGNNYGHAVYAAGLPPRPYNSNIGIGDVLDSAAGLWGNLISDVVYSPVSGGDWTLESDGRRKSPAIDYYATTKTRVSFTSNSANVFISIQLDVSSPKTDHAVSTLGYAFISTLDNGSASPNGGYFAGSLLSGEQSATITIPVRTPGSHFIEIAYKKGGYTGGSDCAWFRVFH